MSTFHCELKSGKPGSAREHAKYIAREGWHGHRDDLLLSGHGNLPGWTNGDSGSLWKASDEFERSNGAAYREFVIALPNELGLARIKKLVTRLIGALVGNKPHQYAVHAPTSSLEGKPNLHLHLMYSDRLPDGIDRPPEQMFSRHDSKHPHRGGRKKDSGGRTLMQVRDEMIARRQIVADLQNAALDEAGFEACVDHRTLRQQGVNRRAGRHLGPARIRGMTAEEKQMYTEAKASEIQRPALMKENAPKSAP